MNSNRRLRAASVAASPGWGWAEWGVAVKTRTKDDIGKRSNVPSRRLPSAKVVAKSVGRGYRFVAVRGIFPLRDQVSELARAMGKPTTEKSLQSLVQVRRFQTRAPDAHEPSGSRSVGRAVGGR